MATGPPSEPRPPRATAATKPGTRAWPDYRDGRRYRRRVPLAMGIAMISVGCAMGGGAAQILFALFGEQVFHRGPSGIGSIWGFAGIGLLIGGGLGHLAGRHASFAGHQRTVNGSVLPPGRADSLFPPRARFSLWPLS